MPLLLFSPSLYSACRMKFQYFPTVIKSSAWPLPFSRPSSTVHPSALGESTPVHPVRSLPLNSVIGLPSTQLPSSCSLISGARCPVKPSTPAEPVILPSSTPFTYFTSYSRRSLGFGVTPGRALGVHVKCSTFPSTFASVMSSRLPSGDPTNWIFISDVTAPVIPSHHALVVVNWISAALASTSMSHRPLKSASAARAVRTKVIAASSPNSANSDLNIRIFCPLFIGCPETLQGAEIANQIGKVLRAQLSRVRGHGIPVPSVIYGSGCAKLG